MAALNIIDIKVLDNPAPFRSPLKFVIKYECIDRLLEETQWKLIYVGSADDEAYDQLLEDVLVASVNLGTYRFLLEADAPDPSRIPEKDKLGLAAILITCSYVDQEFLRVGYYLKNEYDDESLRRKPPKKTLIERVQRTILSEKPKVTKFPINFHPQIAQRGEQSTPEANEEEQAGSEDT